VAKLTEIEGIGPVNAEKLQAAGIASIEKLLEAGRTPKQRTDLAEKSGISGKLLLAWINRADLMRIKGVGEEYSDLLEHAGVDTVPELAQRSAANLFEKLQAVNLEKKLVRAMPTLSQVMDWVEQAKKLPRAINY
jgi:predicted flap endonuclease-1-like 5' DNA nuclease